MPWSNSQFDGTLVIPTGATTGPRIVLNGATGKIEIYDAVGLVMVLDQDGLILYNALGVDIAKIFRDAFSGSLDLGGFYALDPYALPIAKYAFMSGQGFQAGPDATSQADLHANLQYGIDPTTLLYCVQTLRTGCLDLTLDHEARVQLISQRGQQPIVWVDGGSGSAYARLAVTGDLYVGPNSYDRGRGYTDFQAITASTAGVGAVETFGYASTNPTVFVDQRAYRVRIKGYVQSSVANDTVRLRIRKASTVGQQLFDSFTGLIITAAAVQTAYSYEMILRNVSGANISTFLVVTYLRGSGAGNVFIGANALNPAWIEVEDIGQASYYPGANALV